MIKILTKYNKKPTYHKNYRDYNIPYNTNNIEHLISRQENFLTKPIIA